MPDPENSTLEQLAQAMRDAHAKVWDGGCRRPEATDADHAAWVEASARWQAAHDSLHGRGPVRPD